MSIANFSQVIRSQVYKDFLKAVGRNIVQENTNVFRANEQVASKTSFYISEKNIKDMYKTITGLDLSNEEIKQIKEALTATSTKGPTAELISDVGGSPAIFFKNIGWGTISDKVNAAFSVVKQTEEGVSQFEIALSLAEDTYEQAEKSRVNAKWDAIAKKGTLTEAEIFKQRQAEIKKVEKQAKIEGGLGYYFNKGHVVSIATNLVKKFKREVEKAQGELVKNKDGLIKALDVYIEKLQADDLASANLPNAITQELYAKYIQDPDSYLVEFQLRTTNLQSGDASKEVIAQFRETFGPEATESTLNRVIKNNPRLGEILLQTSGSGRPIDKIIDKVLEPFPGQKKPTRTASPTVKIGTATYKIAKTNNKKQIAILKRERNRLAKIKPKAIDQLFEVRADSEQEVNAASSLQLLLNARLVQTVKQNMGNGGRRDILNLRTGRFAESVQAQRVSQSRRGMISVFYSYMRNPYATFSAGGEQSRPSSRDPKLLISKSIRQIAAELMITNLRSIDS